MKKLILLSLVLVLTALQQYPSHPQAHIGDFANLISEQEQRVLEEEIRSYREKSTIHLSVVTVKSLDGYTVEEYATGLFRKWGIGDKSVDNGILILVAPTERKVRIEVGYGLEGDMPDARASRIVHNTILPEFKAGNMEAGILAGAREVMDVLGTLTPQERVVKREKARLESERKTKAFLSGLLWFATGLFALFAGLFGILWVVKTIKRQRYLRQLRREVQMLHDRLLQENASTAAEVDTEVSRVQEILSLKRHAELIATLHKKYKEKADGIDEVLTRVSSYITQDPERAKIELESLDPAGLGKTYLLQLQGMIDFFEDAKKTVPRVINEADSAIIGVESIYDRFSNDGYHLDPKERILGESFGRLEKAKGLLETDPEMALNEARASIAASIQATEGIKGIRELRRSNEKREKEIKRWLELAEEIYTSLPAVFADLRSEVPPKRWSSHEKTTSTAKGNINRFKQKLVLSRGFNSITTQRFSAASMVLDQVSRELEQLIILLKAPAELLQEARDAKGKIPDVKKDIEQEKKSALVLLQNSDVTQDTHDEYAEALKEEKAAESLEKKDFVDHITVLSRYEGVLKLYEEVSKNASSNISSAEEEREERARKKKKRDAQKKASAAAASAAASRRSSSRSSSFGGYGGGRSGGGGASGSW